MVEEKLEELLLDSEEEVWKRIRQALSNSNCLKTHTAAGVVRYDSTLNKYRILSIGSNSCAPEGHEYGDKLSVCPRANITTGTHYELCRPIHAERMACLNLSSKRDNKNIAKFASHLDVSENEIRSYFTAEELQKLNGASLYLVGHYWACDSCLYFLKTVGITDIKLDQLTADKTKENYLKLNIT